MLLTELTQLASFVCTESNYEKNSYAIHFCTYLNSKSHIPFEIGKMTKSLSSSFRMGAQLLLRRVGK